MASRDMKVAFLTPRSPPGHSGAMHPDVVAAPLPELPLRPPAHRVHPRAVTWWRLRAAAGLLVVVVPAVVLLVLVGTAWTVGLLAVTVAAGAAYVVAVPPWLYRISRWEVTDRAVYTLHGWLVREWRIAPISRVQTVDTQRGPAAAAARARRRHRDDRVRPRGRAHPRARRRRRRRARPRPHRDHPRHPGGRHVIDVPGPRGGASTRACSWSGRSRT